MKTVIEMAHEAAIGHPDYDQDDVPPPEGEDLAFFERFADLIRADEREALEKMCEDLDAWNMDDPGGSAAKAIRARGNK